MRDYAQPQNAAKENCQESIIVAETWRTSQKPVYQSALLFTDTP